MSKSKTISPLLVIVGETASGKSALAMRLAEQFGGEIICADSRTVYKGMDIGTAKPTLDERNRIRHYGLDIVSPDEHFTVADFKDHALQAIEEITARGKLPILVGGTGLYIDAVIFDYQFGSPADVDLRAQLVDLSVEELQQRLVAEGIALPTNAQNPRHLIRAIETGGRTASRSLLRPNTLVLGLQVEREVLLERIAERVDMMLVDGLVDEARRLSQMYGWDTEALQATSYKAIRGYIEGTQSLDNAKAEFIQNDMRLAKRQRTWFGRNKSIHWLTTEDKLAKTVDIATTFLNK